MQNIGVEFKMRIHSQRWNHKDSYNLEKTEDGWIIKTMKFHTGLKSDQHGSPGIEKALSSESISYPHDLGYFLSDIWEASQNRSVEEVQSYFDQLADWISRTEETKPNFSPLSL